MGSSTCWYKINVDGAAFASEGCSGMEAIIKNELGDVSKLFLIQMLWKP